MKRLVIHTKDVMIVTGKSERYSRYLIKKIKEEIGKQEHQYLTIREFSEYLGLNPDEVSHNKSVCFLVPQYFTHLFSHLLHAVSVIPLRSISSTASATHTCRWYHSTPPNTFGTTHKHRSTNRKFFPPNPTPTKTCAKPLCILQRSQVVQSLSISCFPPRSTRSRLAAFQSFLLSLASQLPETYSCSPCCLAPRGSAQGCFTLLYSYLYIYSQ